MQRRPIATAALFSVVAVLWAFPNVAPIRFGVSETCPTIRTDGDEIYGRRGDRLGYDNSERRPCNHGHVSAFEFFNHERTFVGPGRPPLNLVSAGLVVNENAAALGNPDEWHEYTFFEDGNHFVWKALGARDERFFEGTCDSVEDVSDRTRRQELRHGMILESKDLRTYPREISHETWDLCNHLDPNDPKNRFCEFAKLQIFIPNMGPRRWCRPDQGVFDYFARETYRKSFIDHGSFDQLRALAQDKRKTAASEVPEYRYLSLTKTAPKICMRWVDDTHYLNQKDSAWQDFADVAAVWCDQ